MSAILNSLNAHNLLIFQPILLTQVSKFMVYRALSDKTYLLLGLLSPLRTGVGSAEMSHLQNCSLKIYLKRALGGPVGGSGWRCERRIKFFVIKFLFYFFGGGGGGREGGGGGSGGGGRYEQRSEVFVKIQKKMWGGSGWGGGGQGGCE